MSSIPLFALVHWSTQHAPNDAVGPGHTVAKRPRFFPCMNRPALVGGSRGPLTWSFVVSWFTWFYLAKLCRYTQQVHPYLQRKANTQMANHLDTCASGADVPCPDCVVDGIIQRADCDTCGTARWVHVCHGRTINPTTGRVMV